MFDRPRNAIAASLVFALVAGYVVVGHYLYKLPVGLDQSGFLAGYFMDSVARVFAPDATNAMSGVVLLVLSLLGIGAVAFFAVRAAVRSRLAARAQPQSLGRIHSAALVQRHWFSRTRSAALGQGAPTR